MIFRSSSEIKKHVCAIFFPALLSVQVGSTQAQMAPLDDSQLGEFYGQAYIAIDRTNHPEQTNVAYTRINLGMDVEIMSNADVMELGRYEREGEKAGSSDILIENFGLGYIHTKKYFDDQPYIPQVLKADGSEYAENEMVPFQIKNPFVEFAYDEDTHEMIGVRIGFGDTLGILSGNIKTLTGAIDVDIRDSGEGIREAQVNKDATVMEQLLMALTPILVADGGVTAQAKLLDADGNEDAVRAERVGVPNGTIFTVDGADSLAANLTKTSSDLGWINNPVTIEKMHDANGNVVKGCGLFKGECYAINIEAKDCLLLGAAACFDLTDYQAMPVGVVEEVNGKKVMKEAISGLFMSFQTRDTPWSTTKNANDAVSAADFVQSTAGAFFNIPNGTVEMNLGQVYNGVPGIRKEYIDRGVGLF